MALSSGKAIIAQRQGDTSYMLYVGLQLPDGCSKANAAKLQSPHFREQLLKDDFAVWSTDITDLIKYSDGFPYHAWALHTLPSDAFPWTSQPGVTLVGDAAHVTLPNGEGVNLLCLTVFN